MYESVKYKVAYFICGTLLGAVCTIVFVIQQMGIAVSLGV